MVKQWLSSAQNIQRNLSYPEIRKAEIAQHEGRIAANGAFVCDTGKYTGRSPNDKFIVSQSPSKNKIWWGDINRPCTPAVFDRLCDNVLNHYKNVQSPYIFDGYCGANPATSKRVRIITELAWQHHFVTNMFIPPKTLPSIEEFSPDFTIINACKITNPSYEKDKLNSDAFVLFDIEDGLGLIGGTWYGGEMKKGMFSMMNYWLPEKNIMPMHCSANVGKNNKVALFFGLSGTGKTTLSADPERALIGDDEHGWDDDGIFNFEGGCYAKTIGLSEKHEPEIYAAIKENALLENVVLKKETNEPDYDDTSKTQNGRVSYPLKHITNRQLNSKGGHPSHIIFLVCDAFGVLPPVSRLTVDQAMYHFISGYTAKVAGTERGITKPTPTFSPCFGAAFLPLHPSVYADLFAAKLTKHDSKVYMVNTGWTGGGYGVGKRISIKDTRACVNAILSGEADLANTVKDPIFGVQILTNLSDVNPHILVPRKTWENSTAYDEQAIRLASMFRKNYAKYTSASVHDYSEHGPINNFSTYII